MHNLKKCGTIRGRYTAYSRVIWHDSTIYYFWDNKDNRLITPYEQRARRVLQDVSVNELFTIVYGEAIEHLVPDYNSYLQLIKRENSNGSYYPVPLKGY